MPHIFKYLEKTEIFNLRLACKRWNIAVDTFLENHPSVRPYDVLGDQQNINCSLTNTSIYRFQDYLYTYNNLQAFTSFQRKAEDHPRNPFLGRSVSLVPKENVYLEISRYFSQAIRFFNMYGEHIWYVTFANFTCMFLQTPLEFYKGFRECLVNLPNLKSLELEVINISKGDDVKNMELVKYLESNPLPSLSHLESLDLTVNGMPQQFHEMFYTLYSSQLRKLSVKLTLWKEVYGNHLQNLTELQLRHVRSLTMLRGFLRNLNSPLLQKCSLFLGFPLGVMVLFQLLERFKQLRVLKVTSDRGATTQARLTELVPLSLVHLKSLETLELQDSPKLTYAFMIGLPSLQSLIIWKNKVSRGEETVIRGSPKVHLRKYIGSNNTDSMYQSNVWTVVPKLKSLTVKSGSNDGVKPFTQNYSRQGYEIVSSKI